MSDGPEEKAQPEILVVDDMLEGLQFLTNILTANGYSVRPATSGLLALRSVEAKLPDLILLDVKMRGMDGFEVCRRLKADERSRDVPVLFVSGLGDSADKIKGFAAGGLDYITKPYLPEEVLARVRIHLRLHELTARLEKKVEELEAKSSELEKANRLFVGRELRMVELKEMIRELEEKNGRE